MKTLIIVLLCVILTGCKNNKRYHVDIPDQRIDFIGTGETNVIPSGDSNIIYNYTKNQTQ